MRMKPLLGLGFLGAVGASAYAAFRYFAGKDDTAKEEASKTPPQHAAFAEAEAGRADPNATRDAGPESMRSDPPEWDAVDEASDESFPASDPPARY